MSITSRTSPTPEARINGPSGIQRAVVQRSAQTFFFVAALLPAIAILALPFPAVRFGWLCRGTGGVLVICLFTASLPEFGKRYRSLIALLLITTTQAMFQAWCYNTASHPAFNSFQLWGILPQTDANLYYTQACDLLYGNPISAANGARHPYPAFLASLLWLCKNDLRLATSITTLLIALATWTTFEIVRRRMGWLAAFVYLACITFCIRIYCTGLLMTETMAVPLSLCGAGLLVESLWHDKKEKLWLWCLGLFFLAQAMDARPAAYFTLPFLIVAAWPLFQVKRAIPVIAVSISLAVVVLSLLFHGIAFRRAVAPPRLASNAWYCIYGMLNDGGWYDGRKRALELGGIKTIAGGFSDSQLRARTADGTYKLRSECLTEIRKHPEKLLHGLWRGIKFSWRENTPFRSAYPKMPAVWFTESMRWATVIGSALAVFFLVGGSRLFPNLAEYRQLAWILLAALTGFLLSLPFAPPWDGGTRIYAATLPLFYLLPAFGIAGCYAICRKARLNPYVRPEVKEADFPASIAVCVALALILIANLAPWLLVSSRMNSAEVEHPVVRTLKMFASGHSASAIDLTSLASGYRLRIVDDNQRTSLPFITKRDFVKNAFGGDMRKYSSQFKQLPVGSEIVALPYWAFFVLDASDVRMGKFKPAQNQASHVVWPPVYFSEQLHLAQP